MPPVPLKSVNGRFDLRPPLPLLNRPTVASLKIFLNDPVRDLQHRGGGRDREEFKSYLNVIFLQLQLRAVHTFFFIRIQFIRILRLRFGTNFFRKWGNICTLQKKGMSNKTGILSIYLGVGVSGKSPKIVLEFKNISDSEKIKVFL